MLEVLRMQLGQVLGGGMKWLVVVVLVLPVLLTVAIVGAGGIGDIERELAHERKRAEIGAGIFPETARRVRWNGEDLSFGSGTLVLGKDGITWRGNPVRPHWVMLFNRGRIIVRDNALWIDEAKPKRRRGGYDLRFVPRRDEARCEDFENTFSLDLFFAGYLFLLYPQVICLLLALFYGTSLLGQELGGRTLTYLFTRPLPRWKFVLGKYLGSLAALILPTVLSLLVSWLVLGAQGGLPMIAAIGISAVLALVAYNAIFALFGFLIPRRALIVALLYGVVFELVLSFIPALVNQVTVTYYLRSLAVEILELPVPREAARVIGGASVPGALLAIAVITVTTLAAASMLAARREYVVKEEA